MNVKKIQKKEQSSINNSLKFGWISYNKKSTSHFHISGIIISIQCLTVDPNMYAVKYNVQNAIITI